MRLFIWNPILSITQGCKELQSSIWWQHFCILYKKLLINSFLNFEIPLEKRKKSNCWIKSFRNVLGNRLKFGMKICMNKLALWFQVSDFYHKRFAYFLLTIIFYLILASLKVLECNELINEKINFLFSIILKWLNKMNFQNQ